MPYYRVVIDHKHLVGVGVGRAGCYKTEAGAKVGLTAIMKRGYYTDKNPRVVPCEIEGHNHPEPITLTKEQTNERLEAIRQETETLESERRKLSTHFRALTMAEHRKQVQRQLYVYCRANYDRTGRHANLPAYGDKVEVINAKGRTRIHIKTAAGHPYMVHFGDVSTTELKKADVTTNRMVGGMMRSLLGKDRR